MAERLSDVDHEVQAQEMSALGGRISQLENLVSDLLLRIADIEKVNSDEAMRQVEQANPPGLASVVDHATKTAFAYSCPFCDVDMTGRVRAAMLREETSYSVQLTCPNNHTATYLPPPREQARR
jgi:hypothetical protein